MSVLEEGSLMHFWQVGFSTGTVDVVPAVAVVAVVDVVVVVAGVSVGVLG